ncbi:MAG: hypothetical protein ACI81P_003596 [Neolewinella sp.]
MKKNARYFHSGQQKTNYQRLVRIFFLILEAVFFDGDQLKEAAVGESRARGTERLHNSNNVLGNNPGTDMSENFYGWITAKTN